MSQEIRIKNPLFFSVDTDDIREDTVETARTGGWFRDLNRADYDVEIILTPKFVPGLWQYTGDPDGIPLERRSVSYYDSEPWLRADKVLGALESKNWRRVEVVPID